ncbi:MAG: N-acetyltransferase [Chloroflexota bacterium]
MTEFVPASFEPPAGLEHAAFRLRPLGPEHNYSDYLAWSSSLQHIRSSPGWADASWPHPMTLEENLRDLGRHADDFAARTGFTYTVLTPSDDESRVIGCVYIYPARRAGADVSVRSWVTAESAHLDGPLYHAVSAWLKGDWPFRDVDYAERDTVGSPG